MEKRVPVERLGLGDHACLATGDHEARWELLTAYTQAGFTRGERVMLILDPDDLSDDDAVARLDAGTGRAPAAARAGQLDLSRNVDVYVPDGKLSKTRMLRAMNQAWEAAAGAGYAGVRAGGDMRWAQRAGVPDDEVVDYEAFMANLFVDPRFVGLCWYDRITCSDHLVAATLDVHPLQVMERLDTLEVTSSADGVRVAGRVGEANRAGLAAQLGDLVAGGSSGGPVRFDLDLTDLLFIEAHYACQFIEFAAALPAEARLAVRCGSTLAAVLRGLGAGDVPQLELREA
ncbi:MEDS domain-containing protein [Actinoplanes subtropicus]|uniref:MEDS domain-containing protein n=1 Tax=Actinoplanes subtropicus TaxID=543632 RepID=UPI0004C2E61E|nr:MEDS domain-containing protein [Actinoplanes subtropicus]